MPNDYIWDPPQELLSRQSWRQSYLSEVRVTTIYIAQPLTKWAIKSSTCESGFGGNLHIKEEPKLHSAV